MVDYEALYQTKEDLVDAAKFIAKLPRIYANYPTLVGEERGINKGAVASLCFFVGAVEGLAYGIPLLSFLIAKNVPANISSPIYFLTTFTVATLRCLQGLYGFNKYHKK